MRRSTKGLIIAGLLSSSAMAGTFNLDKEHVPGELIVKFRDGQKSVSSTRALAALGAEIKTTFKSNGALVIKFGKKLDGDSLVDRARQLNARDDVEYVEANTILHATRAPNDPSFSKQYGMHNTGEGGGVVGADIHATEAWDVSTGSKDVLVGIIDTGVDYTHPDIAANYWTNPGESGLDADGKDKRTNGIDDDGNGYIDDFRGWDFANNDNDPIDDQNHGTHCAGVIGAKGDDGVGVTGVNWNVSMVGIKFLTSSGSGTLENALKSIEYATKLGVTLTSNSWGGGAFSQTMFDVIKAANEKGILFIAAAGNDSNNNDKTPSYPASYVIDNIISVAASDSKDVKASFSNYGKTTVDVAAPGVDIYSTIKGNEYKKMSGTSMATPHVAGLAALVKAVFPNANAVEIKSRIVNGSDPIKGWENFNRSGGRVNAASAIEIDAIAPSMVSGLEVVDSTTISIKLRWLPAGDDGTAGVAKNYLVRSSAKPILNTSDWDAAAPVDASITKSENEVTADLGFAAFNQTGYIAVRAVDNVGNRGDISSSVAFATKKVERFFDRSATSLEGFTADEPWAIEVVDGSPVFSDSPGGKYKEKQNVSLTTDSINIAADDVTLMLEVKHDIESTYDNLWIEVSTDNAVTWKSPTKLTGTSTDFVQKMIPLKEFLKDAHSIRLRFRLETDTIVNKEGVMIRNIGLVAPKQ